MYKYVALIGISMLLHSCQPNGNKTTASADSLPQQAVMDSARDTTPVDKSILTTNAKSPIEGQTFLLGTYRVFDEEVGKMEFKQGWLDLRAVDGKFQLAAPDYNIEQGFDECTAMKSEAIISNHNSLLYFQIPNLNAGEVNSLKILKDKVLPNHPLTYTFEDINYQLQAEGKLSAESSSPSSITDYKLHLSINGAPVAVLIDQSQFNDTFMRITFVGDLDRDGKLDFVFSVPRDYEEERTLVFLSSTGYDQMYEASRQFDC